MSVNFANDALFADPKDIDFWIRIAILQAISLSQYKRCIFDLDDRYDHWRKKEC